VLHIDCELLRTGCCAQHMQHRVCCLLHGQLAACVGPCLSAHLLLHAWSDQLLASTTCCTSWSRFPAGVVLPVQLTADTPAMTSSACQHLPDNAHLTTSTSIYSWHNLTVCSCICAASSSALRASQTAPTLPPPLSARLLWSPGPLPPPPLLPMLW
jgi:hypothetical protein